ncbi:MAG: hypothetical protein PWQ82_1606 [Thermosediminibacterales bacterium]|nr:hypothetical protein [Thermosediminibacterales bacterium]
MAKGTKTTNKVDYTLLIRRKILDSLDSLRGKELTVKEIDKFMERLFKNGKDQVVSICLSKLKESDEDIAPIVCYALQYANDSSIISPLMDILLNPRVDDMTKTRVLGILADYGVDIGNLPLDEILHDFDRMASDSMEKMLQDIDDDMFFVSYILEDFDTFTPEMKTAYIKDLGDTKDERAVILLESLAQVDDPKIAQEAVRQLGRIKKSKALSALQRVLEFCSDEITKNVVSREIRRLKMIGIHPEGTDKSEFEIKQYKAIVSSIDGLGSRALWFSWRHPKNKRKLCSINLLVNIKDGIKDCWAVPEISVRDFNSTLKELKKEAEVLEDYEYALKILQDALNQNRVSGKPVPTLMSFWKRFFRKQDIVEKRYDPEKPNEIEEIVFKPDFDDKTFYLFDMQEFKDWFISQPRVYDYAEIYLKLNSKGSNGKNHLTKMKRFYKKFSDELILPKKEEITRMMELTWDFLFRKNKLEEAKQAYYALTKIKTQPLYELPFIQRIIIESIKIALNNLKKGFDLRAANPRFLE